MNTFQELSLEEMQEVEGGIFPIFLIACLVTEISTVATIGFTIGYLLNY
jgi:lactobin A/cerein 7B family class IIb bacteriocin